MKNLRYLRLSENLTQKEMADLLGIGLTTYHMYETSDRDVPYRIARDIADVFSLEVEDIFLPTRFTVSKSKREEK